jgi:hypothetical protein
MSAFSVKVVVVSRTKLGGFKKSFYPTQMSGSLGQIRVLKVIKLKRTKSKIKILNFFIEFNLNYRCY